MPPAPARGDLAGRRILFVDDEAGVRRLVAAALGRFGATVVLAASGEEAYQRVAAEPAAFHLVVTDFRMPGMDGAELFRRLKRLAPELPLVLTTGYAQEEAVRRCLREGVRAFLPKPFSVADLLAAVRTGLGEE
ncbi:MAG: response regulator, partial [Nitrospirae bacterium]